jgi:hypothetical protein
MKTKINFRLGKKGKRATGCLDVATGIITNAKDKEKRHIFDVEKYDEVGYFETYDSGKLIQKKGRYESGAK